MLIPQFYDGSPFVDMLRKELAQATHVDIASAWARASGVGLILQALMALLERGGSLQAVIGVDRENTSIEGLEMLLRLQGQADIWVRHNEASSIYHPKFYAFKTTTHARAYIGSNNLTGAGLSTNEELSALLVEPKGGQLEASISSYMAALVDTKDNLAHKLDAAFLKQLVDGGYVLPESRLRGKSARTRATAAKPDALFGFKAPKRRHVPPGLLVSAIEPGPAEPSADWKRIFVKLRLARGTQGQLPVPVAHELRRQLGQTDLDGPIPIILNNVERVISPTFAKRNPNFANTYKIEMKPSDDDPVIKIELVGDRVLVQQFDTKSPAGQAHLRYILDGLHTDPVQTFSRGIPKGASSEDIEEAAKGVTLYRYD
ncbi:phospholipase D-like domain-containing protein [Blastomonas sp.]|uniref:phospholipase D-like domain-containing protein n=1 Tax=Blastomonas sp. TaxID=1909299 RepID=UPI0039192CC4